MKRRRYALWRWGKTERFVMAAIFISGLFVYVTVHFIRISEDSLPTSVLEKIRQVEEGKMRKEVEMVEQQTEWIDINVVVMEELIRRGMDLKLAKRLIKYRDVSGGFKDQDHVLKVYGLSDSIVNRYALSYPQNQAYTDEELNGTGKEYKASKYESTSFKKNEKEKITLSINKVQSDELSSYKIPEWLIKNLMKNRERLGNFKNLEDVLTTYGLDSSMFFSKFILDFDTIAIERIATIQIDTTRVFESEKIDFIDDEILEFYDLNTIDSQQLVSIRGIGAKSAVLILEKRRQLGGFYSLDQLSSIRLHPNVKEVVLSRCSIDSSVRTIDIISEGIEEIARHPYISNRQSHFLKNNAHKYKKGILPARHKAYFTEQEWSRVKAYIAFE